MPFGLSNVPVTFQACINKVLHPYLDVFCIAYIDDILVYSDDLTSYKQHVRFVIEVL
jgi:Reverse transcriptase (RNA-dependent DNA polymerase)